MAKGKPANEDGDTCEDGIEEVEGPHGTDTDEVEERALNAQIGERLVQTLEDSICAMLLLRFVWHKPSSIRKLNLPLYAPEPTQHIYGKNGNARSCGNASKRLFCAWFAVREAVAADHDCDQTCNFRDRPCEEALDSVKAGIEW
jgi:hypothetical protein